MVERSTLNSEIVGSNPGSGAGKEETVRKKVLGDLRHHILRYKTYIAYDMTSAYTINM